MVKQLTLFIISALLLTSCKKDDDKPVTNTKGTEPRVVATIDGVEYNFEYYSANTEGAHFILYLAYIDGRGIDLEYAGTKVGSYTAGANEHSRFLYYNIQGFRYRSENSSRVFTGSITEIDEVNKTICGTFEFEGCLTNGTTCVTVTKGVFENIPYTE